MHPTSQSFKNNARRALSDDNLQRALARAKSGFIDKRLTALSELPEFDCLREQAKEIKDHTLAYLDYYLECFEAKVESIGGHVHWGRTAEEACNTVVGICQAAGAKLVSKGKSMVSEEIGLNDALIRANIEPVETDLGEYVLQLANEPPSHIIAPAVHKTREQIADLFEQHHQQYSHVDRRQSVAELVNEARLVLRERFLAADVGITGANFLIAETGSSVLVTNEGNGDLTCTLPRVHIVTAGIEKVVPTLEDATVFLRILGRSATGQEMTAYTTFNTGPKRTTDLDGPEQYHVVLVDNGRTEMLGNEFRDMLRCIRCGACLNHCPVYGAIGGHAYGWVYPGPMGAVLTPAMIGLELAGDLPNACTLNGRCESVCPVKIPLTRMLRALRARQFNQELTAKASRYALSTWAFFAKKPRLYHAVTRLAMALLGGLGGHKGWIRWFPFAGAWTRSRDFPAQQAPTFQSCWKTMNKLHD
ncbi:MAG: LutB/LldF family L-lactate oxidation iron-sulfur protein [Gammaproteobacteria bacterium]|nr:LutB/LldF family L-lactate oxidation iron-sulfur protein [Gammaproteobacteria bacterium]MCI0591263.1 LutB/LldF family L-lactate oxidation iron-sulfur protein [Gammaproteobacteria bacterium]